MKVAIQNPFAEQQVAETELSRRICLAATRLGWSAVEVHTSIEVNAFQPDFVIALHNNSPKLAQFPTYGCIWNPPSFFEGTDKFVRHILTYDSYLTSSPVMERWLHQILYNTPKQFFSTPFYTSCPATLYQPPQLAQPRLVYLGSNWDGKRFGDLFNALDTQAYMEVYGSAEGWQHLKHAYRGSLPYDGISVLKTLNRAGVGLCLHRIEHRDAALPSMRIFEIVASGAIAICGEHPFIRKAFGDSVLYIDPDASIPEQTQQISQHMDWIQTNPRLATDKSAEAHHIFTNHYSLEKLLQTIVPHHNSLLTQKGFTGTFPSIQSSQSSIPSVDFIIRIGSIKNEEHQQNNQIENLTINKQTQSLESISFALNHAFTQISCQTHFNVRATIVKSATIGAIESYLQPYYSKFPIRVIELEKPQYESTFLWAGLNAIESDYVAILDTTSTIYPNHIHTLVTLLEQHHSAGVAFAGALQTVSDPAIASELAMLAHFQPMNLDQLLRFEPPTVSHGFLVRRSLLSGALLTDPQLNDHEVLCFLLHLAQRTQFLFSYDVTCETNQLPLSDGVLFRESWDWNREISRLKFIFWNQDFPSGKSIQVLHTDYTETIERFHTLQTTLSHYKTELKQLKQQYKTDLKAYQDKLQQTQNQLIEATCKLEAMKTSKFWKLRAAWFKLKRAIGLSTDDEIVGD